MPAPEAQSLKKIKRKAKSKSSPWHLRAGPTRPLRAPRETGAEKEKKQMIDQIKQTNRGQFNVEGSLQGRTGDAPTIASERCLGAISTHRSVE
jgi:hypothetical protein